ncbi:O-antigen polymerase [Pseudoalteromonas sp. 10-33]|uniref:O-antigen polymerase n=1 Tax=Pseudoalteromonas sp. 10-33 TaxID=1761890 RepID=UPI0007322DAF|nr:O-antigen polymerase [Pseudoalteromonas sp. 10-33]KTF19192.1 hypothetical protein ATS76_00725 [Pseudoalteromonas sp. 10-33]
MFNVLPLVVIILFFWSLFSGDASLLNVPLFPFLLLLLVTVIAFLRIEVMKQKAIIYCYFIILILCFFVSAFTNYSTFYNFWVLKSFLSYFSIILIFKIFYLNRESYKFNKSIALLSISLLAFFLLGTFFGGGERGSFVFGPNILYRVFTILALVSLLFFYFIQTEKYKKVYLLALFSLVLFAVFLTGSRGGLPALFVFFVSLIHAYCYRLRFSKLLLVSFLILLCFIFYSSFYSAEVMLTSRFLNFDFEGNQSLALRLAPWDSFINNPSAWVITLGKSYDEFMLEFGTATFPYPHNIFLELIYFNGFIGAVLSTFLIVSFIKSFFEIIYDGFGLKSILFYITFIIFIGCMFSGNLQDNFILISLMMALHMIDNSRINCAD